MIFYKIRKSTYRYTKPPHGLRYLAPGIQLFGVSIVERIKYFHAAHAAVFHFQSMDFVPLGRKSLFY